MTEHIGQYRAWLQSHGPAGLDYLNSRVPHRYTGIYELKEGVLRNLDLYDKRGEVVPQALQAVPLEDSFCQFVLRDGFFVTSDTSADPRLDGHVYQGVIQAYHGVPLLDNRGELFGTLCHFDTASYGLPDEELAFMHRAARELPRYLVRR